MKNVEIEGDTQKKISDIFDAMKDLLLYKNKMYGDSALKPRKGWYKGDAQNSILVRLMDKQARIGYDPPPCPRRGGVGVPLLYEYTAKI